VFDFAADHSLLTVPASWFRAVKNSNTKTGTTRIKTKCFWPKKGSDEELSVTRLIKFCSDPDVDNWDLLEGVFKGFFKSHREGDAYITEKLGTVSTSSSSFTDIEQENLDILKKKAALAVKEKSIEKRNEKYSRPSPRTMSDMTSRSPTPNVPWTPTSVSQTGHNPRPSTSSYSIPGTHHTVTYIQYLFEFIYFHLLISILPHVKWYRYRS